MGYVAQGISFLLFLFVLFLIARIVVSVVMFYGRDLHPSGFGLVVIETIYTVTDPPVKFFRRIIPPITVGHMQIDLGILALFIAIALLRGLLVLIPV